MSLRASIIIPTYNRALYLTECLDAIAAQTLDHTAFEAIIVDNNSTDNTRELVLNFLRINLILNLRYILENEQGASNARNRGIKEAHGEILCFLDDDSPPDPEWLNNLLKGFNDPEVGCVGGPSYLDYKGQKQPPWLRGDLQGLLGGYSLPYQKPTQLYKFSEFPFGCNMAFRNHIFNDLGYLRTDLDRSGSEVLAAGDTEMIDRVYKAGWKIMYLPDAIVRHIVAPERLRKSHIYRIGHGLAYSHVILTYNPRPQKFLRWFASDAWYAARMLFWFIVALFRREPLWYDDYMRFWMVAQRLPIRFMSIFNKQRFEQYKGSEKMRESPLIRENIN
jgi:glycosyltransferase involved in cell wall biosynthesis